METYTEEEEVSRLCKSSKIRKLGKCLRLHGFIELQECISRKTLAESAGWKKFRAASRLARTLFLSGRQGVRRRTCCVQHACVLRGSPFRQLLRNLPSNDKAWYESPRTEGQRRWQRRRVRHVSSEAGAGGRCGIIGDLAHGYLLCEVGGCAQRALAGPSRRY